MDRRQTILTAVIGLGGVVAMLALTVFPFQYGLVERTVLAGAFVFVALFAAVLDDAAFGT